MPGFPFPRKASRFGSHVHVVVFSVAVGFIFKAEVAGTHAVWAAIAGIGQPAERRSLARGVGGAVVHIVGSGGLSSGLVQGLAHENDEKDGGHDASTEAHAADDDSDDSLAGNACVTA